MILAGLAPAPSRAVLILATFSLRPSIFLI